MLRDGRALLWLRGRNIGRLPVRRAQVGDEDTDRRRPVVPGEVNVAMTDPDGRVLVLDTANRLFFLDPDGQLLETLPLNEAFEGLDSSGWALSPTGRLFLVDRESDRIVEAQLEPPFWPAS